jgi:outer membrane protein assembly factor BamB
MKYLSIAAAVLSLVMMQGCGGVEKEEKVKPAELIKLKDQMKIKRKWTYHIGDQGDDKLYSLMRPVIDGDAVYLANVRGDIAAVDKERGKRLWKVDLKRQLSSAVGAGAGVVLVGTLNGELIALSQENGEQLWTTQLNSEILSAPQAEGDVVVSQTIDGTLTGLNRQTGARLWSYEVSMPTLTLRGSGAPLMSGGVTYAALASGKVVALDSLTGLLVWERRISLPKGRNEIERMTDFRGQPLIVGNDIYVAGYQGNAAAIDRQSGEGMWMKKISTTGNIAHGGGFLFITSDDDRLVAMELSSGKTVWVNDQLTNRRLTAPGVLKDKLVAVADYQGFVHFMNQEDGSFVAREGAGHPVRNDLFYDYEAGNMYAFTNGGRLVCFSLPDKD